MDATLLRLHAAPGQSPPQVQWLASPQAPGTIHLYRAIDDAAVPQHWLVLALDAAASAAVIGCGTTSACALLDASGQPVPPANPGKGAPPSPGLRELQGDRFGFAWLHGLTPSALAWFVFHGLLIGATSLEFIRGRMPLREALLGTAAGLATAAMPWPDTSLLVERALGAGAGFAVVWLAGLAQAWWQPAALGEGSLPEALLFAMAGAWFGWKALKNTIDEAQVLSQPRHPYTQLLLDSVPRTGEPLDDSLALRKTDLPGNRHLPTGCYFRDRCPLATEGCQAPQSLHPAADGRAVRCWRKVT